MDVADLVQAARSMKWSAVLRQPLLHFVLLGGVMFSIVHALPESVVKNAPIQVTDADLQHLRFAWMADTGRAPTDAELEASLRRYLDETVLLREALRLRLDEYDRVTRNRLLMNMRFIFPDSHEDEESLLREARTMGMSERDLVTRRRLIELMEQRIASNLQVSEAETQHYVAQHPERYASSARYGFQQLFFSRDQHPRSAQAAASDCLRRLQKSPDAHCAVNAFLLGQQFTSQTADAITRTFGNDFAHAVTISAPDHWTGPVESTYGWHLLRVQKIEPAQEADYGSVRRNASYALLAECEDQSVVQELQQLRHRYRVQMPDGAERVWP